MVQAYYNDPPYVMLLGDGCSVGSESTAQVSYLWNLTQVIYVWRILKARAYAYDSNNPRTFPKTDIVLNIYFVYYMLIFVALHLYDYFIDDMTCKYIVYCVVCMMMYHVQISLIKFLFCSKIPRGTISRFSLKSNGCLLHCRSWNL